MQKWCAWAKTLYRSCFVLTVSLLTTNSTHSLSSGGPSTTAVSTAGANITIPGMIELKKKWFTLIYIHQPSSMQSSCSFSANRDNNTRPRKATTDVLGDHSHLLNRVWSLHWRISWMLFPLESKSGDPPFLRSMGGSSWLDQSQC